jgi:hypothetical protein
METPNRETFQERMERLKNAALTLTQDQIDACQWVMGTSNWNKEDIADVLFRAQMSMDR